MNEKKKLQPKVRFREFTGENAPDWEQRKLGEVSDVFDGTHQTPRYKDNGVKFLSVENIKTLNSDKFISLEDFIEEFNSYPVKGDVLMTRIGDIGTANVVESDEKLAYYVSLALFKMHRDTDSYFLKNSIHSRSVQNELWKRTLHIAFPKKINKNEIEKVSIYIPRKNEQNRIGLFFEKIDKLITLHQRKLEQLEQLKNTLLSKMFPKSGTNIPEIRFSGFTDAWKQRKLGEMSTSFSGGTPTVGVREYYNGEIPFIRSAEIGKCKTELYISKLGLDNSSARLVSKGDILYAMYGATSGEVARAQIDGAINQAILVIKPVQSVDSEYITQWLRKNKQKIIKTFLQGGQGNLSASIIKNLKVYFPTIEEQQKIGNVFNSFDRSLKFHLNRINELKCLKNNLLNKMFI